MLSRYCSQSREAMVGGEGDKAKNLTGAAM
jgi:hypothetical protein